jgi:hypothetical protein
MTQHSRLDSSGRVISPSQRPLPDKHTTLTTDKHPCPRRDFILFVLSLYFYPYFFVLIVLVFAFCLLLYNKHITNIHAPGGIRTRPLGSAVIHLTLYKFRYITLHFLYRKAKCRCTVFSILLRFLQFPSSYLEFRVPVFLTRTKVVLPSRCLGWGNWK